MSEPGDLGPVISVQDRIAQITNQLTSALILIDKAQTGLLKIRVELARLEEKEGRA